MDVESPDKARRIFTIDWQDERLREACERLANALGESMHFIALECEKIGQLFSKSSIDVEELRRQLVIRNEPELFIETRQAIPYKPKIKGSQQKAGSNRSGFRLARNFGKMKG